MLETANRYSLPHRFPSHALGKLRDDHLKRDAVQHGASGFFVGVHVRILQVNTAAERLQCAP